MVVIHGYAKEEVTMLDVLRQLEMELSAHEAFDTFEWYCKTYHVSVEDIAPATIRYEVFGF